MPNLGLEASPPQHCTRVDFVVTSVSVPVHFEYVRFMRHAYFAALSFTGLCLPSHKLLKSRIRNPRILRVRSCQEWGQIILGMPQMARIIGSITITRLTAQLGIAACLVERSMLKYRTTLVGENLQAPYFGALTTGQINLRNHTCSKRIARMEFLFV